MDKLRNTVLISGRFVLAVLLCVSFVISLLFFALQAVFRRETYVAAAESDAFVSSLHTEVLEHLESECLFYDLPYDTMSAALPVQTVQVVVRERMAGVYDALCTGKTLPSVALDPAPFKAAIDSFFESLPFEERPLDADASQTIATELAQSMGLVMSAGISDKLIQTAHPLFAEASPLRQLANRGFWWLIIMTVLVVISLIPFKSSYGQRAYSTAGALFIGSTLVAVPTWLFVGHDLPSRLAVGDSALKQYVNTVLYTIINRTNVIVSVAFIICLVLLILSVMWILKENKENKTAP